MNRALGLFVLGTFAGGTASCELAEGCDPATDPDCVSGPATTTPAEVGYYYVMVLDHSLQAEGTTSGIDVFGIELRRSGEQAFADVVHRCSFGTQDNSAATECSRVLGAPVDGQGICASEPEPGRVDYVSLGGTGGVLIASFGTEELAPRDSITVYECGPTEEITAETEWYSVYVGTSTSVQGEWVQCLNAGTGTTTCTIPDLPEVTLTR